MAVTQAQVDTAIARAEAWLWTMQAPDHARGIFRFSDYHAPQDWPGVLLPATYNAICCLALCDGLRKLDPNARQHVAAFLREHQQENGVFRISQMATADIYKKRDPAETWRYIDFHVSNYALGALEMLDGLAPMRLDFAKPFLDLARLDAWLATRDKHEPWQEGNNIVNLASFLLLLRDHAGATESAQATAALQHMLDWHDQHQDPTTGFWGGTVGSADAHLHAMAGAAHNLHLYYAIGRPVPGAETIIDYCLSLSPSSSTACLDVDPVDILASMSKLGNYRRDDVRHWIADKLAAILAHQNSDGGFADEADGTLRLDGWVRGYAEPQGISNTFATWFRVLAIAHVSSVLWPEWRQWRFRRMIGIGYAAPVRA